MAWFRVDDHLYSHPKWLALPKGARALWVTAGSWCAGQLLDGFIPSTDPSTAPGRYCASLACRCGHPACPAFASWVPREGQARIIHLPTPRTT